MIGAFLYFIQLSVPDIDAQPPATIIAAAHVTHSKEIRLIEYSIF